MIGGAHFLENFLHYSTLHTSLSGRFRAVECGIVGGSLASFRSRYQLVCGNTNMLVRMKIPRAMQRRVRAVIPRREMNDSRIGLRRRLTSFEMPL